MAVQPARARKGQQKATLGGRRRRVRLPPEKRRQQLLEAVEEVVSEKGYHGTTVPRVVARAGLAQGSFYRYFRDIDEAVCELMRRAVAPIERAAGELGFDQVKTAADLEWELLRFYRVLARELVEHPAVIREALLVAPETGRTLGAAMLNFLDAMRAIAFRLVEDHMGRPPFRRATDPKAVAAAVVGMILGAARETCAEDGDFEPEQWAREMARLEAGALIDPAAC